MKLRPSHEFALAAAARVSCCSLVFVGACERDGVAPTVSANDDARTEAEAPPAVVVEPDPYGGDASLDPSLTEAPISEERAKIERCQETVSAALEQGDLGPAHSNCCTFVAEHAYDQPDPQLSPEAAQARTERDMDYWGELMIPCCRLIENSVMACSPWGPPMPPGARRGIGPAARLDLRRPARVQARARLSSVARRSIEPRLRSIAVATWRGRMVNEHGSAPVFEGLVAQLERLVAAGRIEEHALARARAFPGQERRHGIACGAVVEALGGQAEAEALPQREFPQHAELADPVEACLRNVLSICCLSETVAVSLIAAEREDMPAGPLRELLTEIWADECGHANYGWRLLDTLLATADDELRARLGVYLRAAFGELEDHELAHLPIHDDALPSDAARYGVCEGREAQALFYATVERVIVPGLEARGLEARAAWAARPMAVVAAAAAC